MHRNGSQENSIMLALEFQVKSAETLVLFLRLRFHAHVHGKIGQAAAQLRLTASLLLQAIHLRQQDFVTPHAGQIQGSLLCLRFDLQRIVVPLVE